MEMIGDFDRPPRNGQDCKKQGVRDTGSDLSGPRSQNNQCVVMIDDQLLNKSRKA